MKTLRVGINFYINAQSVEIIQPWPSRPAQRERQRAIETERLYDATGGERIRSVITLQSGWVIVSAFTPLTLIQRPLVAAPVRASTRRKDRENPIIEESDGGFEPIETIEPSEEKEATPRDQQRRALESDREKLPAPKAKRGLFRRKSAQE